jgi:hypothetical protein
MRIFLLLAILTSFIFGANIDYNKYDNTFKKYEQESGVVNWFLLKAVAVTENSNLNPYAIRYNTNGTKDIGLMQINTIWAKEFGLKESDLLNVDTNVKVATIILTDLINKHGYSWETVGMYHSATPVHKRVWLSSIKKNIQMLAKLDRSLFLASN